MSAPTLISIREVTKRYPGVVALDSVKLDIREGECHSIVGENGELDEDEADNGEPDEDLP